MDQTLRPRSRVITLAVTALTLVLLLAACNAPTPTPTVTPTPSPTPTPTPAPDPIAKLAANATWGDLVNLLPDETTTCLKNELGTSYQGLLDRRIFDTSIQVSADALPIKCFDKDSLVDVFIASLSQAAGGLTDNTVTCLRDTFAGQDNSTLENLATGNFQASTSDAMGIGIGLLLCLTDAEAERVTAGSFFGDIGGLSSVSLKDVRCVFQSVDLNQLMSLFQDSASATATPDLSMLLTMADAMSKCGIDINQIMNNGSSGNDGTGDGQTGDNPSATATPGFDLSTFDLSQIDQLPPDLQEGVKCIIEAVGGEENAQGFLDGTYTPDITQLIAASQCPIDLSQLN